jgi:hypothetical protein
MTESQKETGLPQQAALETTESVEKEHWTSVSPPSILTATTSSTEDDSEFELFKSGIIWNGSYLPTTADDGDGEDAWMNSLLPQQAQPQPQPQPQQRTTTTSQLLVLSPRDRGSASKANRNYQYHYGVVSVVAADQHGAAGEHLSNEEWVARRRRRDRRLRRRTQQHDSLLRNPPPRQIVHRSEPHMTTPEVVRQDHHGDILLLPVQQQEESTWRREQRRRRLRRRARRIPMTTEARRERRNHWSTLVVLSSWHILKKLSWRRILVSSSSRREQHEERSSEEHHQQQQQSPTEEEPVGRIVDPWAVSGDGWMWGQDDPSEATHYWSTGTAMETASEDSCFESSSTIDNDREHQQDGDMRSLTALVDNWPTVLEEFPVVVELFSLRDSSTPQITDDPFYVPE